MPKIIQMVLEYPQTQSKVYFSASPPRIGYASRLVSAMIYHATWNQRDSNMKSRSIKFPTPYRTTWININRININPNDYYNSVIDYYNPVIDYYNPVVDYYNPLLRSIRININQININPNIRSSNRLL